MAILLDSRNLDLRFFTRDAQHAIKERSLMFAHRLRVLEWRDGPLDRNDRPVALYSVKRQSNMYGAVEVFRPRFLRLRVRDSWCAGLRSRPSDLTPRRQPHDTAQLVVAAPTGLGRSDRSQQVGHKIAESRYGMEVQPHYTILNLATASSVSLFLITWRG